MANREMPQKNRPPKLVNLELPPPANKAISAWNEENSPLLRLPAEIRTTIFGYAFGGNTMRVSVNNRGILRTRICKHADDYDDITCRVVMQDTPRNVRKDRAKRAPEPRRLPWSQEVSHGHHDRPTLLLTSRKLYHEGCLLSFSDNHFVFDSRDSTWSLDVLTPFFKRYVNNTQARAITNIVLDGHHMDSGSRGEMSALAL